MKTKLFDRIRRNERDREELEHIEREERKARMRIESRRAADRDWLTNGYDGATA